MKTTPFLITSVHQDTTPYPSHILIGQEGALHWSIGPIMDVKINTSYTFEAMECVDFSLNLNRYNILLAVIYRPPDTSVLQFANELAGYVERNINTTGEQIIVGDFSMYTSANRMTGNAIILSNMLESFNLSNCVEFPTDKLQNTLDLVIYQQDSRCIRNVHQGHLLSDHHLVLFDISI